MAKVTMNDLQKIHEQVIGKFFKNDGSVMLKLTFANQDKAWEFYIDEQRREKYSNVVHAGKLVVVAFDSGYDYTPMNIYYKLQEYINGYNIAKISAI